jgi:hypothetical protein
MVMPNNLQLMILALKSMMGKYLDFLAIMEQENRPPSKVSWGFKVLLVDAWKSQVMMYPSSPLKQSCVSDMFRIIMLFMND